MSNSVTRQIFEKADRKAILIRMGSRSWYAQMGWAKSIEMREMKKFRSRKWAMVCINDWLIGD